MSREKTGNRPNLSKTPNYFPFGFVKASLIPSGIWGLLINAVQVIFYLSYFIIYKLIPTKKIKYTISSSQTETQKSDCVANFMSPTI